MWGVVLIFKSFLYVGGAHLFSTNFEYQSMLPLLYRTVDFLEKMLVVIIIPMCLHEDPTVGSTAFWFSRPLTRKDVLATKGLLLAIFFLCIPLVTEMAVLAFSGVPVRYAFLAAPEIIMERLPFILSFVLLASITSRFSEFAKIGAIIIGIGIVWGIISSILMMVAPDLGRSLFYGGRDLEKAGKSLVDSMGMVNGILTIIFFTALVIHQHMTRYTARTVRWAVVSYLLIMMAGHVWTIDFFKPVVAADKKVTIPSNQIKETFDTSHMFIAEGTRKEATKVIRSRFILSEYPQQYYATADTTSTIQIWYGDGTKLESWGVSFRPTLGSVLDDTLMSPLQSALGDSIIKNPWKNKFVYNDIFELGTDDFEKFKGKIGTYAVDMKIDFFSYEIGSVVPLKLGAMDTRDRQQIKIFGLNKQKDGVSVLLMERTVNMLFDRNGQKKSIFNIMANGYVTDIVVLRNSKTKEVLLPVMGAQDEAMSAGMGDYMNEGLRLQLAAKKIEFNFSEAGISMTEDWLKDAELVRLNPKLRATVNKDVRIANFGIPAVSNDPDPALHNTAMSYKHSYREDQRGKSWKDKTEQEINAYPIPSQLKNTKTISDYKYGYLAKEDHKAFAFSLDGPYGYCISKADENEAKHCALDFCNKYRKPGQGPCNVISVDGNILR